MKELVLTGSRLFELSKWSAAGRNESWTIFGYDFLVTETAGPPPLRPEIKSAEFYCFCGVPSAGLSRDAGSVVGVFRLRLINLFEPAKLASLI